MKNILQPFFEAPYGRYIGLAEIIIGALFIGGYILYGNVVGIIAGPAFILLGFADSLPPSRLRAVAVFRVAAVAYFLVLFILWGLEVL